MRRLLVLLDQPPFFCISEFFQTHPVEAEDECGVGSAETEGVRHNEVKLLVVQTLPHNRHSLKSGIEVLDVGALDDEVVVEHKKRVDRLMDACCTK